MKTIRSDKYRNGKNKKTRRVRQQILGGTDEVIPPSATVSESPHVIDPVFYELEANLIDEFQKTIKRESDIFNSKLIELRSKFFPEPNELATSSFTELGNNNE